MKILKDNMRRFRTKNLAEQQAQISKPRSQSEFKKTYDKKTGYKFATWSDAQRIKGWRDQSTQARNELMQTYKLWPASGNTSNGTSSWVNEYGEKYVLNFHPENYWPATWENKPSTDTDLDPKAAKLIEKSLVNSALAWVLNDEIERHQQEG